MASEIKQCGSSGMKTHGADKTECANKQCGNVDKAATQMRQDVTGQNGV